MLRAAPSLVPAAVVGGVLIGTVAAPPAVSAVPVAAVASIVAAVLWRRGRAWQALVVLIAGLLAAAAAWGGVRAASVDSPATARDGPVTGVVTVDQIPRTGDDGGWRMRVVVNHLVGPRGPALPPGTRLLFDLAPEAAGPPVLGARLRLTGRLRPAASGDAPEWWVGYLRRQGIAGRIGASDVTVVGARDGVAGMHDAWRRWANGAAGAGLEGDRGALVRGMLLGDADDLSPDAAQAFRDAGLWHLLAVSGQNVTVVALAALLGLRVLRVARRPATFVALGLICVYCLACEPGPSVARAGVMGAVALVGELRSTPSGRWHLLLVALAVLLVAQPLAIGDPGLQLSFAAVVGLFALAGPLAARAPAWLHPRIAELAALAAAAGVATAPVLIWHFGSLSLVGLPLNVVAVPLAGPIVVVALVALGAAALWHPMAVVVASPAGVGADALLALARAAASAPGATSTLPALAAVPVALAALFAVVIVRRRGRVPAITRRVPAASARPGHRIAVAGLLATLVAAVAALGSASPGGPGPPSLPTLTSLDVGQGDALLLRSPDGAAAMVDVGPPGSPAPAVRALARHGIDRLSFVTVTHPARDHGGGLAAVLSSVRVDRLLLADPDHAGWAGARRIAARAGVPVERVAAGDALRVGEWRLSVLWPRPGDLVRATDPNDASLIVRARANGVRALLTGDAESRQLRATGGLRGIDVLKVGHHGSGDGGLAWVLARDAPRLALVSVGEGNRFGHPHPDTLAVLAAAGVAVLRTDREGDLTVSARARPHPPG